MSRNALNDENGNFDEISAPVWKICIHQGNHMLAKCGGDFGESGDFGDMVKMANICQIAILMQMTSTHGSELCWRFWRIWRFWQIWRKWQIFVKLPNLCK